MPGRSIIPIEWAGLSILGTLALMDGAHVHGGSLILSYSDRKRII